ncbi:MAG: hypothetical protein ISS19_11725 [Bacteroidales bacterium]|nr:hypothetical protein [Bacteroidales bacterium]
MKIGEAGYKQNRKQGKWYIWDDSVTKRFEMEFKHGKKTGTWFQWDENGELIKEQIFD